MDLLIHSEGGVTANQYKLLLTDLLNHLIKHLYLNGRSLFQDDSAPIGK